MIIYKTLFNNKTNTVIHNQRVKTDYINSGLIVTSQQNTSTPGVFTILNLLSYKQYTITICGFCNSNNAFVWIYDGKQRLIPNYTFLPTNLNTIKIVFNTTNITNISIGVLFTNPKINDKYLLHSLIIEDVNCIQPSLKPTIPIKDDIDSDICSCTDSESEYNLPCKYTK